MNTRDYLKADMQKVFKNTDEFAEEVTINGVTILAVTDGELLHKRTRQDYGDIAVGDLLLQITETEWGKVPSVSHPPRTQEAVNINGIPSTIVIAGGNMGVFDITFQYNGG